MSPKPGRRLTHGLFSAPRGGSLAAGTPAVPHGPCLRLQRHQWAQAEACAEGRHPWAPGPLPDKLCCRLGGSESPCLRRRQASPWHWAGWGAAPPRTPAPARAMACHGEGRPGPTAVSHRWSWDRRALQGQPWTSGCELLGAMGCAGRQLAHGPCDAGWRALPGRVLPVRASVPPGRASMPPLRARVPPVRASVPPLKASVPPMRASMLCTMAVRSPSRVGTPRTRAGVLHMAAATPHSAWHG